MKLGYRPLVYMWVAEFSDGSALPMFDPDTGKQNKGNPNWLPKKGTGGSEDSTPKIFREKTLCKFGWYPFSREMAAKIPMVVIPTRNPCHTVELKEGDELVACRRNQIEFGVMGSGYRRVESPYLLGIRGKEILTIGEDGKATVAAVEPIRANSGSERNGEKR